MEAVGARDRAQVPGRRPGSTAGGAEVPGIELSEPVFQDDQAYAPAGWQFGDSKLGVSFLRLRTVQGRHYFTLKQPASSAQDCLEYETQVTDRQAMHQAVLHMGYRPTVRITKTRRTT